MCFTCQILKEKRDRYTVDTVLKGRTEEETEDNLWEGSLWGPGPVTYTHIWTHRDMHVLMHKHTHGHTCTNIHTHMGTYALTDIYTNVHTDTYTQS